jgi:hypothetical protein
MSCISPRPAKNGKNTRIAKMATAAVAVICDARVWVDTT